MTREPEQAQGGYWKASASTEAIHDAVTREQGQKP